MIDIAVTRNIANYGRGASMTRALHDTLDELQKCQAELREAQARLSKTEHQNVDLETSWRTAERLLQERDGNSISDEMLNFLHGCGPLEGFHFGEIPPTERGQFWWRKRLPRPKEDK